MVLVMKTRTLLQIWLRLELASLRKRPARLPVALPMQLLTLLAAIAGEVATCALLQ